MVPVQKTCLVVIDGWGTSSENPSDFDGDAIRLASTPVMDGLISKFGCCPLLAHGEAVGLPEGLMGNSEVGHLNIGAGRVVYQDILRIDKLLAEKNVSEISPSFKDIVAQAKGGANRTVHLIGLLSDGGVHSHIRHLLSLLDHLKTSNVTRIAIHAITDGRDTAPKCAKVYLEQLLSHIEGTSAQLATVVGRYYAMDRDKRWERTQLAFEAMTAGEGQNVELKALLRAIDSQYEAGETDEFLKPLVIDGAPRVKDGDVLVFFNFRSDRMRQIVQAFSSNRENLPFDSALPTNLHITTMTRYREDFTFPLLSPPQVMSNVLGEYLASQGLKQMHVAETEKFSHVTVFFNGGREKPFEGEDRILVPSPKVATYDLQPEMSSAAVADSLIGAIANGSYEFVMCNLAPPDMVGHTGHLPEAIKAVEATDSAIGRIYEACRQHGYTLFVTSDHGNAEKMLEGGAPHKAHTCARVPFVVAKEGVRLAIKPGAALCNVAPTILELMGIAKPAEMEPSLLL